MPENCPTTPYQPFQSIYSRLSPFSRIPSPYTDRQFCTAPALLTEAGGYLLQEDGSFIEL